MISTLSSIISPSDTSMWVSLEIFTCQSKKVGRLLAIAYLVVPVSHFWIPVGCLLYYLKILGRIWALSVGPRTCAKSPGCTGELHSSFLWMKLVDFIQGNFPSLELVCICVHYLFYFKEFLWNTHPGISLWQSRINAVIWQKTITIITPGSFRYWGLCWEKVWSFVSELAAILGNLSGCTTAALGSGFSWVETRRGCQRSCYGSKMGVV